jgi:3-oxoacyl-[acyl-carrier protein] reductase
MREIERLEDVGQQQQGRVALVTGGAVGLGRSFASRLASAGAAVVVGYHSVSADEAVAEITADGGVAVGMRMDVTDRREVDDAIQQVLERFGRIDTLVNNAGGLVARVTVAEMSDDHWRTVLDLNLTSAFYCTRAVAPHLGVGGRIINVSSLAAENGGGPGAAAYAAAKAGLIGLTRACAKELGGRGITVNAISPGFIGDTPFHAQFSTIESQQSMISQAAVGRAGVPGDVSAMVAYLASADAGFVTGAVFDINGGSYFT